MGSWISSIVRPEEEAGGLGDLPESCVAEVLLYLDPLEICRAARLSRAFRGAASADFVWEKKLPKNYGYLMGLASGDRRPGKETSLCKKEIYARLCRPNPFDGGTKEFWLEKSSGGICLSISSKALLITGIGDRRYWKYLPTDESRFGTVAYLQQVWWFEVNGESISASRLVPTAYSSDSTWVELPSVLVAGFVAPSTSMGGTGNRCSSSSRHRTATGFCPSAT